MQTLNPLRHKISLEHTNLRRNSAILAFIPRADRESTSKGETTDSLKTVLELVTCTYSFREPIRLALEAQVENSN